MDNLTEHDLAGMTVNERLSVCNLIEDWDRAVINRNKVEMVSVLKKSLLSEKQAVETTDSVLANPSMYGY
jgi:hypothetical protein